MAAHCYDPLRGPHFRVYNFLNYRSNLKLIMIKITSGRGAARSPKLLFYNNFGQNKI
jgi:hypothetical protein